MTKDTLNDYSTTPGNNTDVAGQNIAENCAPGNINNAIRELMADVASVIGGSVRVTNWYTTSLNVSGTATIGTLSLTTASATTLTISGNGTIGGTFGVTGAATLSSTLAVTGAITGSSTITGTVLTGTRFVATGSTVATNGLYLPATDTVGISTASTLRLSVNASGALGIGSSPDYGTAGYVLTSAGNGAVPTWSATAAGYTPTGTLGAPLNASFPIGAGALVIKAGTGTTGGGGSLTVTFGTAFPNAIVSVVASMNGAPSNANTYCFVSASSTSAATIDTQSDSGTARTGVDVAWIAVGY